MKNAEEENHRVVISRLVFTFIFICLLFRFFLHTTPSFLLQPPLFHLNLDLAYWAYAFLKMPALIIYNHTGAVLFDILLFSSCILAILFPLQRLAIILFTLLFQVYAITYNTFMLQHSHPLAVATLITYPFWFKKYNIWKIMWEGMRYYICYVYVMSFIWKTGIGDSFFYWRQGIGSVKINLAEYIYHNPASFMTAFFTFFLAHPALLNIGATCIFLAEGLMATGFFTKRYDRLLLFLAVSIHLCTFIFSDVFFIEMLVLIFAFFTINDTSAIGKKFPLILKHRHWHDDKKRSGLNRPGR